MFEQRPCYAACVQFIVIGLDLQGQPNPKVDRTLSLLGAAELTAGVWIAGTDRTVAEIGEELALHLAPGQKLKVVETVHGGWTSVLQDKVLVPRPRKQNGTRAKP